MKDNSRIQKIKKNIEAIIFRRDLIKKAMQANNYGNIRNRKINKCDFIKFMLMSQIQKESTLYDCQGLILERIGEYVSRNAISDLFSELNPEVLIYILDSLMIEYHNSPIKNKLKTYCDHFKSILACDSTIIPLVSALAKQYKHYASKNCNYLSAIKLHAHFDIKTLSPTNLIIDQARVNEKAFLATMTEKDTLYLCDLGYYKHDQFISWIDNDIYFISRLLPNVRLTITSVVQGCQGWVGKTTKDLTSKHLNRYPEVHLKAISIEQQRKKENDPSFPVTEFDVYGVRVGNEIRFLIANVPESLSICDIMSLYRARWLVELFFKIIKSNFLSSKKFKHPQSVLNYIIIVIIYYFLSLEIIKRLLTLFKIDIHKVKLHSFMQLDVLFYLKIPLLNEIIEMDTEHLKRFLTRFVIQSLEISSKQKRRLTADLRA